MDREELAVRYLVAWNKKDVPGLLKLMHPQASYYNAFWEEICNSNDLSKYFSANLEAEMRWYRQEGEIIATLNGMVLRYVAFDIGDPEGLVPIFNGADVFTISDGLIVTISDYYCDPDPVELIEIAKFAEKQHSHSNIARLGLSAKISGRIKRRLAELVGGASILLDPSVTVTQLADHVGCSVMHLFHVLEEEKGTTFLQFVNECRARYATTVLIQRLNGGLDLRQVAEQSGFRTVEQLNNAFQSTFGSSAEEYLEQF